MKIGDTGYSRYIIYIYIVNYWAYHMKPKKNTLYSRTITPHFGRLRDPRQNQWRRPGASKFQKQSWVPKWCLSLHLSWALGSLKLEINGFFVFFHVIHPNFYSFHKIIIVCSLPKWVFIWILTGIVIWLHGIYLVR